MRLLLPGLSIIFLSCTTYDYHTVASPDGLRCITFEYNRSMIPNDTIFVKMYLGDHEIKKDQYVKMIWSDIGGVAIDWDSSPIKVRSWLLKKNTIPADLIDVNTEMSTLETQEFHEPGSSWKSYDFTWISEGRYKGCD